MGRFFIKFVYCSFKSSFKYLIKVLFRISSFFATNSFPIHSFA